MPKTLAAALIAGKSVLEDPTDFERCVRSLDGHVDRIFVSWNGGEETPGQVEGAPPITYEFKAWEDDFSVNRNHSFEIIHRWEGLTGDKFDWILWLDTDDTLEGAENLQSMLESLDSETQGVFLRYDYSTDLQTGTVLAVQWRERLFRGDARAVWHYPIHEICHCPPGTQYAKKNDVWVKHWRQIDYEDSGTRERNRRILAKARREQPDEPRFAYYMANEVYAEAALAKHHGKPALELINAAIKAYEDFIPDAPSPDDAYIAAHQIAELKRMADDHLGAIESDLQALMIHPSWPDAYVGIAQSYMEDGDWVKCEFWARACINNASKTQETTQVREPLNNEYLPRLLLAMAMENQGRLQEALDEYCEIAAFKLTDEIDTKIQRITDFMEENGNPTNVSLQDEAWMDIRKERFSSRKDKSICFFTNPLFEPWHPELMKTGGIGGAETCVMEVAKRFADDGWRTVVFGTPGEHAGVAEDGVEYYPSTDFGATEEFTVFVSSRSAQVFDANINAKKRYLWMHDVNIGDTFKGPFGDRIAPGRVDGIIGLTNWHCKHLARLYDLPESYFKRVPNGVDLSRFDQPTFGRSSGRFIWSSSPDRGLDVVLKMWPEIRQRIPHAELHVFYGWTGINKILDLMPNHYLGMFKESINGMVEQLGGEDGGIFWHDRVDQQTLAHEMKCSDMWLYPTYFMETFCITAIEMLAAGVIPVTSSVAALTETVPPEFQVGGWPNNVSFTKEYLRAFDDIRSQNVNRDALKAFAQRYTWDNAYENYWKKIGERALSGVPV